MTTPAPTTPPAPTNPDTSIYSLTSTPIGNHCVAGAGFDVIRPAAEFMCQRERKPEPGVTVQENLSATATAGQGLRVYGSVVGQQSTTVGGYTVNTQGGASVGASTGGAGGELRVGIRADIVGRQGSSPNEYRPYIEVNGSSRTGLGGKAGVCTDVSVPVVGTKVEVCGGVQSQDGRTRPQVQIGTALNI